MPKSYTSILNDERLNAGRLTTRSQQISSNIAIHIAAIICGIFGFLPLPIADAIPITIVQAVMMLVLGIVYDQKASSSIPKGFVGIAAATLIGRTLVRLIPVVGGVVSAIVALAVTEFVGWSVAHDMSELFRKEWERQKSAKEAADAYAEVEHLRAFVGDEPEAEDFSD